MRLHPAVLPSRTAVLSLFAAAVLLLTLTLEARAQPDETLPKTSDLEAVEQDLARERDTLDAVARQADQAAAEERNLRDRLIDAADRVQSQERTLIQLENRLAELETRQAALAKTLADQDERMREVVMALQRLAVRPTDALMLQPLKPSDAIRSGLVLSAAVPALTENAEQLRADLDALYRTRAEIIDRQSQVATTTLTLIEEQTALERLVAEKASQRAALEQEAADAEARMTALSKEAEDLRDLLERVMAERKRQEAERPPLVLTPPDGAAPPPELAAAPRPAPPPEARSFADARGTMPFPATGRLTQRYGEAAESDLLARGILIETRPSAPVVSPFDAVVAFAGPFRGYGLLLILEHSEGYHTLLAGLTRLDGVVGQSVLAGEPVGAMAPEGNPSLYVELRRDGQPINPLPWLAAHNNEISG